MRNGIGSIDTAGATWEKSQEFDGDHRVVTLHLYMN